MIKTKTFHLGKLHVGVHRYGFSTYAFMVSNDGAPFAAIDFWRFQVSLAWM